MRSRFLYIIAPLMLLNACVALTPGTVATRSAPKGTGASAQQTAASTPQRSADGPQAKQPTGPAAPSGAHTSASFNVPDLPAGPSVLVTGTIRIDANYVISAGGGNVINAGGGNVISAGGGNVISAGGGNVISAGGGNVINAGGGNYRLLANPELPLGTMLPVHGMAIVPVSLVTGKPVGQPVLTDEQGHYKVAVSQAEADARSVLLIASLPGKSATDPRLTDNRLQYALLVSPKQQATDNPIDEDSAIVTAYTRKCFVSRLADWIADPETKTPALLDRLGEGSAASLLPLLKLKLQPVADALKAAKFAPAEYPLVASRLSDALLARTALQNIKLNSPYAPWKPNPEMRAYDAILQVMGQVREKAALKMADPGYFEKQSYILEYNAAHRPEEAYQILKPTDLCFFLADAYMSRNGINTAEAYGAVMQNIGLITGREPDADSPKELLDNASVNLIAAIGMTLLTNPDVQAEMVQSIEALKPSK